MGKYSVTVLPCEVCVIGATFGFLFLCRHSHVYCSGDRLLTDVMFANEYGMVSILVGPLNMYKDHPVAFIVRFVLFVISSQLVKWGHWCAACLKCGLFFH